MGDSAEDWVGSAVPRSAKDERPNIKRSRRPSLCDGFIAKTNPGSGIIVDCPLIVLALLVALGCCGRMVTVTRSLVTIHSP